MNLIEKATVILVKHHQTEKIMAHKMINGVDVDRLNETMDNIREDKELATFKFRAKNEWKDGGYCVTSIKGFYGAKQEDTSRKETFTLDADEPDILLGTDKGPNATEAALYALSSCLTTTFIYHAAAQGVKVEEMEMELEGELDLRGFLGLSKDVRNGFKDVNVTFHVKADVTDEKLQELCRLAQLRSPVFDIVTNPVPVNVDIVRKGEQVSASKKAA